MRRKYPIGRRTFNKTLSRSGDIIAAMRVMPLVKTQRHDGPTIWAMQNGHEVAAYAARHLIEKAASCPAMADCSPRQKRKPSS
jgi:hypothetical protein